MEHYVINGSFDDGWGPPDPEWKPKISKISNNWLYSGDLLNGVWKLLSPDWKQKKIKNV
jgi:hypothetical protein